MPPQRPGLRGRAPVSSGMSSSFRSRRPLPGESSHPVFPSSAPVRCSLHPSLAAGPLLPFIPAFSHPPSRQPPRRSPGTAHPALASIRACCVHHRLALSYPYHL